ncbi:adenylate/guanylate cyclase domain-containing protein [Microvirga sp. W0021]|uniref:Adenylate/guanylate cyclase domain-containing protein n=1 Tax=Hohaiivirga grylli TaxID=3133970 RepID=A0ABV0BJM2_9HYPH
MRYQWWTPEFWRMVSGLILFSFALTHFLNHALGLISLDVMMYVQDWRRGFWRSWPGTFLLAGAFLTHISLALWKIAKRRTWRMPVVEAVQIISGLAIPIMGAGHVFNTRVVHSLYGFDDNYAVILNAIKMGAGWKQSIFLIVVWVHSTIGLNHWLRSKVSYPNWSPVFWTLSLLIPSLALSGWVEGARQVSYGMTEQQILSPQMATAKEAMYNTAHLTIWVIFGAFVLMILFARLLDWIKAGPVISFADGSKVQAPAGATLLEISRLGKTSFAAVCGGRGRCTTCRCLITSGAETLPAPTGAELAALERMDHPENIRLACQIKPVQPLSVRPLMPVRKAERPASEFDAMRWGVEQRITVMFVDLRGFTSLAERLYPFDSIFLLNRFFEVMAAQVERHNGIVDKYLGDGFMALFGMRGSMGNGSKNAILAAQGMLAALEQTNEEFRMAIGESLRMGIGVHTGRAVLGRVGDLKSGAMTALGDSVNVAARLENLNKEFNSELIVSDSALSSSGLPLDGWEHQEVELRGRDSVITIYIARASAAGA